jgi:hypothetical protein
VAKQRKRILRQPISQNAISHKPDATFSKGFGRVCDQDVYVIDGVNAFDAD